MKRALLITYHFPPSRAAGAVRWGSFSSTASSRDWAFDVLCFVAGAPASSDARPLREENHGRLRVFAVENPPHWVLTGVQKIARLIRRLRSNPSAQTADGAAISSVSQQAYRVDDLPPLMSTAGLRQAFNVLLRHLMFVPWAQRSANLGAKLANTNNYDVIISSGPPHLAADAARRIARVAGVPLVLDFRDPWSTMDVLDSNSASVIYPWLARRLERKSVADSKLIFANTERARLAISQMYPHAHVRTLPNGYDGARINGQPVHGRFVAIYAGAIYLDRDPRPIFRALQLVRDELELTSKNFAFRLIGECSEYGGVPIERLAESFGVADLVETQAALPRATLYEQLASAAILVNLPQGARLCIPSKVYEYAQFPAWILAIEPNESATRDLLSPLGADVVSDDPSAIAGVLSKHVRAFREGHRATPLSTLQDFGYERLADQLFAHLEVVAERR